MKKKMLICGGAGFHGRNAIEYFLNTGKYDIKATWHRNANPTESYNGDIKWIQADLTKPWDVKAALYGGVDIILQYAAVSTNLKDAFEKPYLHVTDNAVMNSLIFKQAYEEKVEHVIFPSCTVMYEDLDKPVKEEDFSGVIDGSQVYYGAGTTKVYLENMCKFYSEIGETKFTALRQTNIIGKYDKTDLDKAHFFAAMIQKINSATKTVDVWGDGTEEKDLLSIGKLMELIDLVLEKQTSKFELLNVGSGKNMTIKEIVENVIETSGKKLDISFDTSKPSRNIKLKLDVSKAMDKFNWDNTFDMKETINEYNN
jgi:nucleoside-diphosphate-sugar epimerase